MANSVQLCLVLHNHQPVGNFDHVFEDAYQDSYLPFLDVLESFEAINLSLHTSGPLAQWLDQNHPEYLDRLANLVATGRIEIVGGAYYEPILTMIPGRDRVGQISRFSDWLTQRLSAKIGGMWIPERVWESGLTRDIATADIGYTILDDFHFRRAGLTQGELTGYYVVEDEGKLLRVFPGSEQLRYLIPFAPPGETIDYCRRIADEHPGAVLVFGDDGEKFGTWPETKQHVYENGWLESFFQALTDNRDWLKTSTLAEAVESTPPQGKIYLPDASYREMTEWAQPVERQADFEKLVHEFEHDARWPQIQSFLGGGFWRNFKVKYPETNQMYARMMYVSRMLEQAEQENLDVQAIDQARDHLYQGQCNCSYWHGAFGGIYLPHLRNAIYQHLIEAENLLDDASGRGDRWVDAHADDFNFDGRPEIRLANDSMVGWIAAHQGGQLYELDLKKIGLNLGATISRRPELYHDKVRQGVQEGNDEAASIHDRVIFKQEGLDERLQYDDRLRTSLIDHFWDEDAALDAIFKNQTPERGDFADGEYQATIRRNPDRVQVMLTRSGNAWGVPLTITKGITFEAGSDQIEFAYLIEGIPEDREFHFGVEFNFAGLPDGQEDRFFSDEEGNRLGHLGEMLSLDDAQQIGLSDGWLGLDLTLKSEKVGGLWAFPVQSISQSEAGFEMIHQAVSVQPHWKIKADSSGRWSNRLFLTLATRDDESAAEIADRSITQNQGTDSLPGCV